MSNDDAEDLRAAVERIGVDRIAAFFAEPVIGAGVVHPPESGYLESVAKICAEPRPLAREEGLVVRVQRAIRERGVIVPPLATALAASPPLTIDEDEIALIGDHPRHPGHHGRKGRLVMRRTLWRRVDRESAGEPSPAPRVRGHSMVPMR